MTWIVGAPGLFRGFAAGLSDVRVTFKDGSELDCLRKIYLVGPHIAAGFAGSVRIGFAMIQELSELLSTGEEGQGWNPEEVAGWWPKDAKAVFNCFSDNEKHLKCQIMLLGAHPFETVGTTKWPKTEVYIFTAPDFEPVRAEPKELLSIGSGSSVKPYQNALAEVFKNEITFAHMEIGDPGGFGRGLMLEIAEAIRKMPTQGISPHVHICLVTRSSVRLGTNDLWAPEQPELDDFLMPKVAESWKEFEEIVRTNGALSEAAEC